MPCGVVSCDSEVNCKSVDENGHANRSIGIIAGNGSFPIRFARNAKEAGFRVVVLAHENETDCVIENIADHVSWIKVGQVGRIISVFKEQKITSVAMVGGINRVRTFRDVHLDARGAVLLAKLRSTKDDIIMRGIASELATEGIEVVDSTLFCRDALINEGGITKKKPTTDELKDINVGVAAICAMSEQHIGQLVVVKQGVIVAVEAVEGSDATILRGGELGGQGTVVVKCAKPSQDMRFDVPTIGLKTIETMKVAKASVLALEAQRCLILDREQVIEAANEAGISIVGCRVANDLLEE